jgi:hypothetical protein
MMSNHKYKPDMKGDDGLVAIFCSTICPRYVKSLKQEMKPMNTYKKIEDFIQDFLREAKRHMEIAREATTIPYHAPGFRGNVAKPYTKPSLPSTDPKPYVKPYVKPTGSSHDYDRRKDSSSDYDRRGNAPKPYVKFRQDVRNMDHEVSHMEREWYESDPDEDLGEHDLDALASIFQQDSIARSHPSHPDTSLDTDTDQDDSCSNSISTTSTPTPTAPDDSRSKAQAALHFLEGDKTDNRGCIFYALYGKCMRGDQCQNKQAHNPTSSAKTREWIVSKCNETARLEAGGAVKLMTRDRPGAGR